MEVMKTLTPTHVVFGKKVGEYTGENALTANVGETDLYFILKLIVSPIHTL